MKKYKNPIPTVDIIIEIENQIVLIERKDNPPGIALPGGYINEGETAETAAIREAKEETGLDIELDELFYVYSDPRRDPRQHTLTVVYTARAQGIPHAGDDAKRAFLAPIDGLPGNLAFDHARILSDYIVFRTAGRRPSPEDYRKFANEKDSAVKH